MGLNAKKIKNTGGNKQAPMEEGTYPCRVVQIIDMGMQKQRPYKGKPKPPAHMLRVTYEFLDEFCFDEEGNEMPDKPRWLSEEFPLLSLQADLAKSTKRYKAIDPNDESDGDFTQLVKRPVLITVVNNESKGEIFNNVGAATAMRQRDVKKAEDLKNEPFVLLLDETDVDGFATLPTWLQDKIKGGLGFEQTPLGIALSGGEPADDEEPEDEDGGW